ncbi:MAG: hypothetical protein DRO36_06540 [Candidatus Hecatellales archaeon]|nr:MAG: hypothetical protein DRO36_06540 [Candidatus Hecatellales archaeon]
MDSVSHAAWGATIIRKLPHVWWAVFFGLLPDIIWGVYWALKYRGQSFNRGLEVRNSPENLEVHFQVYYFVHSLIPITVVTIIIYLVAPSYTIVVIPYYLHIIMDIFTHQGVWATRIFYPLSDFYFEGRDWWRNRWISIGNWLALVVINLIIFIW